MIFIAFFQKRRWLTAAIVSYHIALCIFTCMQLSGVNEHRFPGVLLDEHRFPGILGILGIHKFLAKLSR